MTHNTTSTTTTSASTCISNDNNGPIINGDLLWNTPSIYDDLNLDDVFTYRLKPEDFDDFKIPDNISIRKLQIVVFEDDLIGELHMPLIPPTITDLDIHLSFDYKQGYDYSSVVKMIKQLQIPTSVVCLTISNESMITGIDNVLLSIVETDKTTTKKRKIADDSNSNREKEDVYDYFIPSSVTKLNVPWVSKEMESYIPPTVTHLVFHIEKSSFNIPNTVKHVEIVKQNASPKLQRVPYFAKFPKEIETLTTGDYFKVSKIPLIRFRFNLDYLRNYLYSDTEFRTAFEKISKPSLKKESIFIDYDLKSGDGAKVFIDANSQSFEGSIPSATKNFYYEKKRYQYGSLPLTMNKGLQYFILNCSGGDVDLSKLELPQTLEYFLIKGGMFKYGMDFSSHIPPSVSHLEITLNDCFGFNGFIPTSVRYLKINNPTNKSKYEVASIRIPSTLIHLSIDEEYRDRVKVIPIEDYDRNNSNSIHLNQFLKTSITKLDLTSYPNNYIPPYSLPANLDEIIFGNISQPIEKGLIPATVKRITFNSWDLRFNNINFEYLPNHLSYFKFSSRHLGYSERCSNLDELMSILFAKSKFGQVISIKRNQYALSIKVKDLELYLVNNTTTKLDFAKFTIFNLFFSSFPPTEKFSFFNYSERPQPFFKIVSQSPTHLSLLGPQKINPSLLPKDTTDLTIPFETNEQFLMLPKEAIEIQDSNNNNRHSFSEPFQEVKDLFLCIWRNTYLRTNILDQLLNPSRKLVQDCLCYLRSTLFISRDYELPKKISKYVFKIHLARRSLSSWSSPFKTSILKRLDIKYHVYEKSKPIPMGTTHIIWPLNETIMPGVLPDSVYSITFGNDYNQPLLANVFDNVFDLHFGKSFTVDIKEIALPPKLKYLTLGELYNHPIQPNTLPPTLKHIGFHSLDQDSDLLNSLKHLPPSVDHLLLLEQKYYKLKDLTMIPPWIKYIKFSNAFYRYPSYKLVLPSTVKCVLTSKFPDDMISQQNGDNNPTTPSSSHLTSTIIPPVLVGKLKSSINVHLVVGKFLHANSLVDNVKSIRISTDFVLIPGCLPKSLECLEFHERYNQPIVDGVLPPNLKKLVFGILFNQPVSHILPKKLEELEFGEQFEQQLSLSCMSPVLKKLTFKAGYYHEHLIDWIPSSVTDLTLGHTTSSAFDYLLPVEKVPTHITKLTLGDNQYIKCPSLIPTHIKHIRIGPCQEYDQVPHTIESLALSKHHDYLLHLIFEKNK
ncbi:hypothetical protein CYY_008023 [Polysphondylium violaceum]|uniref:FNIP repeat-containing protein n=1 Tax=Polysphondylium violaceum TaxID=133409 RepID=A0A8J4PME9_9MYCE|nr:hypothetical protein CYY_008023 [Polysphondylium violaceum]